MKYVYGFITLVAILVTTVCLTTISAKASTLAQPDCTPAMIQGSYQFFAPTIIQVSAGTVIAIPEKYLDSSPVLYASQGVMSFDGKGHGSLQATADMNGKLSDLMVYEATYTFNADCAATVDLSNGTSFNLRIVHDTDQPRIVSTTPGVVLSKSN